MRLGEELLLSLHYPNSAEISRLNLGLKRRRNKGEYGFDIDPQTGEWSRLEGEPEEDPRPDRSEPVRIVPIVRDRKNALLVRFAAPEALGPETFATLQHALVRGIATVFELEEGEGLGEPPLSRDNRRSLLIYEASEGGAGVLSRLVEDPTALPKVARAALSLMHFREVEAAIAAEDPALLTEAPEAEYARACSRCLLSYYNQPDHELIDRGDSAAQQLLINLARASVTRKAKPPPSGWDVAFENAGVAAPDGKALVLAGGEIPFAWRAARVAAALGPIADAAREEAEACGWELYALPPEPAVGLLAELRKRLKE